VSNSSPKAIVEFQQTVGNFSLRIQDGYRKASEEITSLQILCSEKLLEMTEEFEAKHNEMLNKAGDWLGELNRTMTNPDMNAPIAQEMKKLGQEIRDLKKQIIRQMRAEIGSDTF
jgi:DnaJ-domain-containing protein 1